MVSAMLRMEEMVGAEEEEGMATGSADADAALCLAIGSWGLVGMS